MSTWNTEELACNHVVFAYCCEKRRCVTAAARPEKCRSSCHHTCVHTATGKKKEKEAVVFLIFTVACPCITFNYIRHTLHNRPPAAVDPTTPRNTNTRHVLCNTSGRKSNNIDRDRLFIPRDLFARPKIFSSTLFREDIQRCEHPRSQR